MILTNGDSWTGGPTYPSRDTHWPYQLSQKYGLAVKNLAWGGVSNARIYRTTIEYLYSDQPKPTHLIIGWSSNTRAELPTTLGLYMRVVPTDSCTLFIENDQPVPNIVAVKDMYYRDLHNEDLAFSTLVHNMLTIRDLCEFKGIKLGMFNSHRSMPNLPEYASEIESNWILPSYSCMRETLNNLNFELIESRHTVAAGQVYWADLVYSWLNL